MSEKKPSRVQYGRTALIKTIFILSQREAKARELHEILGIPMRTVYRMLVYIRESGILVNRGTYYSISPIWMDPVLCDCQVKTLEVEYRRNKCFRCHRPKFRVQDLPGDPSNRENTVKDAES